jgi:hypothetical protein
VMDYRQIKQRKDRAKRMCQLFGSGERLAPCLQGLLGVAQEPEHLAFPGAYGDPGILARQRRAPPMSPPSEALTLWAK